MNHERTITVRTECEKCEFAVVDPESKQQVDCRIGRLQKYSDNLLLAEAQNGFYIINTWCNAYRNKGYCANHTIENLQQEIAIQSDFIILAIKAKESNDVASIITSVKCAHNQLIKPSRLIIVVQDLAFSYKELYDSIAAISDIPFIIVKMVDPEADVATCIDTAVSKCSAMYYTLWVAGFDIPIDYLSKLNFIINDELKQFSMIEYEADELNGFTVQTQLHKILDGNINAWIGEKIKFIAEQQNKKEMVVRYE